MHDDLLERRLRSALHDETRSLSFTITAAELERRAALRGRGAGNRRLTLLLAATVAIGTLGAGFLVGGLLDETPAPTSPITAQESTEPTGAPSPGPATPPSGEPKLPSLDALIATKPDGVLIAQAYGPSNADFASGAPLSVPTRMAVELGTVHGEGPFQVQVACLGHVDVSLDIRVPFSRGPLSGPTIDCNGTPIEHTSNLADAAAITLHADQPVSWRIVVRSGPPLVTPPTADPVLPPVEAGVEEELVRLDDRVHTSIEPWGESGMLIREVATIPYRMSYQARLWCLPGDDLRLVFGLDLDGVFTPSMETHLACDGTVHALGFTMPSPHASEVHIAAASDTRYSLLVSGAMPPVAVVDGLPGWQLVSGMEPEFGFAQTNGVRAGMTVTGEGPLQVIVACAGTGELEVEVDLDGQASGDARTFVAPCSPEGLSTVEPFDAERYADVLVTYDFPKDAWTALSILIPE